MTIRAPLIYNRPLGQANQNPPGFIQGRVGGPSGGKQFAGNGQWKAYDYPNPTLRADSNYLAAYLRQKEGSAPNLALLKGLDKQFAGPGQWKTYDYPNPRGYEYPVSLRTWLDPTKQQLIGKDTQFGGFGQWKVYDYPNPWTQKGTISLLSWTQSLNQTTLSPVTVNPFVQKDWPNPSVSGRSLDLLTWIQKPLQGSPFRQTEWAVPAGALFSNDFRSWLNAVELTLIGQDKLPFRNDWVVPKGAVGVVDYGTWLQNLSQSTLAPIVVLPFRLLDWKNPDGYLFPSDLRTIASGFSMLDAIPPHPPEPVPQVSIGGGASGVKRYRPPKWWEEGRKRKTEAQLKKEILTVQKRIEVARKKLDLAPDLNKMEKVVERLQDLQQRLLFLLVEMDDLHRQVEEDEVMKIYTIYRSLH